MVGAFDSKEAKRQVNELLDAVRAGDKPARDRIIEIKLPLCTYHVKMSGASASDDERSEVLGECRLALVEAVARIAAGAPVKNANAYLGKVIRATAKKSGKSLVSMSRRTHGRRKKAALPGEDIDCPRYNDAPMDELPAHKLDNDPSGGADLWDELMHCCTNDLERRLLQMAADEMPDEEIAANLNMDVRSVWNRRSEIKQRYKERNEC